MCNEDAAVMIGRRSAGRQWFAYVFGASMLIAFPAAAYIDGALASQIFQVLIAGGLAALLFLKHFWANVKLFFQTRFARRSAAKHGE
jgi:hypothetical protein